MDNLKIGYVTSGDGINVLLVVERKIDRNGRPWDAKERQLRTFLDCILKRHDFPLNHEDSSRLSRGDRLYKEGQHFFAYDGNESDIVRIENYAGKFKIPVSDKIDGNVLDMVFGPYQLNLNLGLVKQNGIR